MNRTRLRKSLQQTVFAVALLSIALLALAAPATARAATPVPTNASALPERSPAAAIAALLGDDPGSALAAIPDGFVSAMRYRPALEHAPDGQYPTNPDGSCSSPVPLPTRFEPLCRTHDLGYDLLRYAQRSGQPVGTWARSALDSMLINRMIASCTNPACTASARVAQVALGLNTWRQHDGAPATGETTFDIIVGLGERGAESVLGQR